MPEDETVGRLFSSGSVVEQIAIWGVLYEAVRLALQPFFNELGYLVNEGVQTGIITPADLTTLVQRSVMTEADAANIAKKSGISPSDFNLMLGLRRLPPGVQEVIQLAYRGVVPWDASSPDELSVQNAVRQSDVSNEWYIALKTYFDIDVPNGGEPIPISDVVDAAVESQITMPQAIAMAREVGVSPDRFQVLFNTRGNPPGTSDLIELVRRGFIPAKGAGPDQTTLEQGIYESATKDKWEPIIQLLLDYLPPPRTVTALQRAGAIDSTEALSLYKQQGLSDSLASAYVANASSDKLAGSKQLAESVVTKLYYDLAIDAPTATSMLEPLGYDAAEAAFILEVQDLQRVTTAVNSAITRIGTLFIAHKIDAPTARQALGALNTPATQIEALIQTWLIEAASNLKTLTQAEITDAFVAQIMDQDQAMSELEGIGYTPYDAWVLLSLKNKANLPNQPAENLVNPVHPLPSAGG